MSLRTFLPAGWWNKVKCGNPILNYMLPEFVFNRIRRDKYYYLHLLPQSLFAKTTTQINIFNALTQKFSLSSN